MAQQHLAVANVSMLRRVPQGAARGPRQHADPKWPGLFFFRAGWLPLLKMQASKQAIVPCIMLPRAHNFDGQRLEKIVS